MFTNKLIIFLTFFFSFTFISQIVFAHCPLCTAATGAAVATARLYGVDDLITGTFIGGLIISTTVWLNNILKKKNKQKDYISHQYVILILASVVLTILTFYFVGILGNIDSHFLLFGVDRILIGLLTGSFVTLAVFHLHSVLREFNGNKNFLPFQVIILTLAFLSLVSFSYFLVGWV